MAPIELRQPKVIHCPFYGHVDWICKHSLALRSLSAPPSAYGDDALDLGTQDGSEFAFRDRGPRSHFVCILVFAWPRQVIR